jgi:hypothetical protein
LVVADDKNELANKVEAVAQENQKAEAGVNQLSQSM